MRRDALAGQMFSLLDGSRQHTVDMRAREMTRQARALLEEVHGAALAA